MPVEAQNLIPALVAVIVMFIPIGGLFWKFSRIVFQVELNKQLGKKTATTVETMMDNVTKVNFQAEQSKIDLNGFGQKYNIYTEIQEKKMNDVITQIGHMSDLLTRMEMRMTSMIETITEMKSKMVTKDMVRGKA